MLGYHMCIELDLVKAYDSVWRNFLEMTLRAMHFPSPFIRLVMDCVKDSHLSVLFNWSKERYFKSTCRLRQGCPLSSFHFSIVMDFFSIMVIAYATSSPIPTPWWSFSISPLMFVDELIVFSATSISLCSMQITWVFESF